MLSKCAVITDQSVNQSLYWPIVQLHKYTKKETWQVKVKVNVHLCSASLHKCARTRNNSTKLATFKKDRCTQTCCHVTLNTTHTGKEKNMKRKVWYYYSNRNWKNSLLALINFISPRGSQHKITQKLKHSNKQNRPIYVNLSQHAE